MDFEAAWADRLVDTEEADFENIHSRRWGVQDRLGLSGNSAILSKASQNFRLPLSHRGGGFI